MKRTALITGGNRGIGRQLSLSLAHAGYNIVINYKERHNEAEQTAADVIKAGAGCIIYAGDVSDYAKMLEMYNEAKKCFGFIDTVVNNAGVSRISLLTDDSEADYDFVMGTNMKGVFNVTKHFVPDMIERGFGRIINISSIWGQAGGSMEGIYSASKAAVIGFTKALAKELGPSGITVNAIAPGAVATEMIAGLPESALKKIADDTPCGRIGLPDDISGIVEFLSSKRASFVTGQIINASGGYIII